MPIKEIMTLSTAILISLFLSHPTHFRQAVQNFKYQILRDIGRTDNWGNPSLFAGNGARHKGHRTSSGGS